MDHDMTNHYIEQINGMARGVRTDLRDMQEAAEHKDWAKVARCLLSANQATANIAEMLLLDLTVVGKIDFDGKAEELARQFTRDTGLIAPFKDEPQTYAGPSQEQRQEAYEKWYAGRRTR